MLSKNDLNKDNTYTTNALVNLLGCNRNTIVKKLNKKDYPVTTVRFNNRDYTAYVIPPEEIEKLAFEISSNKGIRFETGMNTKNIRLIKEGSINTKNDLSSSSTDITNVSNDTILRNVKNESKEIIELMTRQQVLESENMKLKDNLHEYQLKNLQLANEKVSLESKVLMIEDKQSYTNSELSRTTQELTSVNKQIEIKNRIILGLSSVLLIIITVAVTLSLAKFLST